ncbi:MAG: type 1 glutamine amidotransferase-like domain-containing protein [Anaerolineae bacterium]|jgi:cyanophycinase|nr:type 1 glutamine amidotransferase-like domain-containing protein [Anaerolineae bacterium]
MNGLIALVGAGEYLPVMNEIDRHLLASVNTNGRAPRVVCMPTAAGQEGENSVNRWLKMGIEHFEALGAEVTPAQIIDRNSANDRQWEAALEQADLIYFSGGKPGYLYETMQGSRAWKAAQKAWERGAVYAGCSAGAMILADRIPNIRRAGLKSFEAFQIFPARFVIPHFDRMRGLISTYLFAIRPQLKDGQFILGVDENTALVGKLDENWQVMGDGNVHLITRDDEKIFSAGEKLRLA